MSFEPSDLVSTLQGLEQSLPDRAPVSRYVVAFSGGLDSTVLLHALVVTRGEHGKDLLAVHVDHQLQDNSARWADHCRHIAGELGVEYQSRKVDVPQDARQGPEAAARDSRYAVFADIVGSGDVLLSAHHRDDQAETLLLNLLRGSGPAGVAGIPRHRPFGEALIVRPMLDVTREQLRAYATSTGLEWIEDPANLDSRFDRNFLRNELLPVIEQRWPNVGQRLGRSAMLARDAAGLLQELADIDLATLGDNPGQLDLLALRALSSSRQRNVLRRAVALAGLPPPSAADIDSVVLQLLPARDDAMPLVCWPGAELRRYRQRLYLMSATPVPGFAGTRLGVGERIRLGAGMGRLSLHDAAGPGLSGACVQGGLELRQRSGGEKLKPLGQLHTKKLKKLLQDEGIVPWMRDRLPLLYSGDRLVAVADLWIDAGVAEEKGVAVQWSDKPLLY